MSVLESCERCMRYVRAVLCVSLFSGGMHAVACSASCWQAAGAGPLQPGGALPRGQQALLTQYSMHAALSWGAACMQLLRMSWLVLSRWALLVLEGMLRLHSSMGI
jgi:hypothetical protein